MHSYLLRLAAAALLGALPLLTARTVCAGSMGGIEERVVEETLPNGLKVIVLPRSQSPSVSLFWRFRVGAVQEEQGMTGLAHLLEHMLFKGTKRLGTTDYGREAEIRRAISGNLCRCTGYQNIVKAIQHAARSIAAGPESGDGEAEGGEG